VEDDAARLETSASGEPDASALRARLIESLRTESGGLSDPAVAHAMATVPRHLFLPQVDLEQAYADIAVPTHFEDGVPVSSASQPAIVAVMLQQLQPYAGMRVLEIGAGTGYNAALLAELAGLDGAVATVDIAADVADEARTHLDAAGYRAVQVITGDGAQGWPPGAPYDRVELTAGASDISPAWATQLREGGMLVLPLWLGAADVSVAFRKRSDVFTSESLACCGFMRLRGAESDAYKWISLAGGWRLASDRADELAAHVAVLLATRPRHRLWTRPTSAISSFAQYLALRGHDVIVLWPPPKARRRVRPRFGLYAEGPDGPSLCLFGALLPVLHRFGGVTAEEMIEALWHEWRRVRLLPLEEWRITAHPRTGVPLPPPLPDAARHLRRHYVFDVTFLAALP
jgi:protein-L-isoaspartate(D-aspartate) O-methyltransferase